jgi:DNA-binding NarL/FixJ family response regulator
MLLEHEADIEIVGEAGAARETLEQVARLQRDLVLMDIGLALAAGD